jgi:hypothetical protein
MRQALLATMVATVSAVPAAASAEEPRTIDFQGGLAWHQPIQEGFDPIPAVGLELRAYSPRGLWLSGAAAVEPSVDLRNPEHGELHTLFGVGVGAGLWLDLGTRITLYGGGRLEWAHEGERDGVRLGPVGSLAVLVGHAWGHPMALEAKLSWLNTFMDSGADARGWQGGLYLSGTLFPDRPL